VIVRGRRSLDLASRHLRSTAQRRRYTLAYACSPLDAGQIDTHDRQIADFRDADLNSIKDRSCAVDPVQLF